MSEIVPTCNAEHRSGERDLDRVCRIEFLGDCTHELAGQTVELGEHSPSHEPSTY